MRGVEKLRFVEWNGSNGVDGRRGKLKFVFRLVLGDYCQKLGDVIFRIDVVGVSQRAFRQVEELILRGSLLLAEFFEHMFINYHDFPTP